MLDWCPPRTWEVEMSKRPPAEYYFGDHRGSAPNADFVRDASGKEVPRPASLLQKLLWRSAGNAPIPPKRGRGRPRKGGAV